MKFLIFLLLVCITLQEKVFQKEEIFEKIKNLKQQLSTSTETVIKELEELAQKNKSRDAMFELGKIYQVILLILI